MSATRQELIIEMLKSNPNDPFLVYAAALEYRKSGDIDKTLELFYQLVKDHGDYLATYYQLGKVLEEQGEREDAIKYYKMGREVARKQDDRKTLSELSEALMILDEDDGEVW